MYSLLSFRNLPILDQLHLEEALLRTDQGNWCLVNTGSPEAIVVGISGKPHELFDVKEVSQRKVPIIRRYSGGGTVYIDPETIFVTWIGNGKKFPRELLQEGAKLLAPLFPPGFAFRENDYVIGDLKIGGNAQYLTSSRWMHHISFLWDYSPEKMQLLSLPTKRPHYRQDRPHHEFLTTLKTYFPSKEQWLKNCEEYLLSALGGKRAGIDLPSFLERTYRKGTTILN